MRKIVIAALIAVSAPAFPFDFRGVQIGQTCRDAVKAEQSLGTTPRGAIESMLDTNVVIFEDKSIPGKTTRFLYSCTQNPGVISRYSIDVRTRIESLARDAFSQAKSAAVLRLGEPTSDSDLLGAEQRAQLWRTQGFALHGLAKWKSVDKQEVIVMLEKLPDDEWSVATIVGKERPVNQETK